MPYRDMLVEQEEVIGIIYSTYTVTMKLHHIPVHGVIYTNQQTGMRLG